MTATGSGADFAVLGKTVHGAVTAADLDVFPTPRTVTFVEFRTDELTAFCPVTGQPDFYDMRLAYEPGPVCVESKSLKLYLLGYRDRGVFCEALAAEILADVVTRCGPTRATVTLTQHVRGGLTLTARADHNGGIP
jgi:7-cyano-7-deazaguanine reductase